MSRAQIAEPTPQRRRRSLWREGPAIGTEQAAAQAGARIWRAVPTLDRLHRDGAISARQHSAGERYRTDYELGVLGARDRDGGMARLGYYYPEAQLIAVEGYKRAVAALGARLARYVEPIVLGTIGGGDVTVSDLARALGENRQAVAGCLRVALDTLADHYGLA